MEVNECELEYLRLHGTEHTLFQDDERERLCSNNITCPDLESSECGFRSYPDHCNVPRHSYANESCCDHCTAELPTTSLSSGGLAGAIIGACVGGVFLICIIGWLTCWVVDRNQLRETIQQATETNQEYDE